MKSLPEFLEGIVAEMRDETHGWSEVSEAALFTRDRESGIITLCRWGEDDGLLEDVGWNPAPRVH